MASAFAINIPLPLEYCCFIPVTQSYLVILMVKWSRCLDDIHKCRTISYKLVLDQHTNFYTIAITVNRAKSNNYYFSWNNLNRKTNFNKISR